MKILASSDMHGNLSGIGLSGIGLAVFAGDISPLRGISSLDVYDQLVWMNTEFYDFCMSWPKTKIVFVPGNHDFFPIAEEAFGYKLAGKDLRLSLAPNATMLIDQSVDVPCQDGSRESAVRIYGTPWVPIISHRWAFEAEHSQLIEKFSQIPRGCDILIAHAPPRLNYLDVSLDYGTSSSHFGSSELADAIATKEPKMCFCGHIHSGDHKMNKLASTEVWNVSRVDESYEIAYEPTVLEI